ncbi:MAG: NAD(P)/FAD-dependent oxidoreductase [Betaproteobacteria bacterium]|nr:MAG: NAD(P)/FAD-dependent oxidoreductase [Betaproteobacteria bacterium]
MSKHRSHTPVSRTEKRNPADGSASDSVDVVIVGAGFAGMYMLHRLREAGFSALVLEAGSDVGGTWYWNRYPGARCDVESMQYSYQFSDELQQEWDWSEKYATQPEILRYADHVADRFDLRRDIRFNIRVKAAQFDDDTGSWLLTSTDGEQFRATFCVMATGCLSAVNKARIDGLESFKGNVYHTGEWPHEGVDFTGQRVAVIGTGSSAIQAIPIIAQQAEQLYVFQRTPNYTIPAHNAPLEPQQRQAVKDRYREFRDEAKQSFTGVLFRYNPESAVEVSEQRRREEFEARWAYGGVTFMGAFSDLLFDRRANDAAAGFVRSKIRQIVKDPEVAEMLCPDNIIGCKRLCVDTDYYATYNRSNVELIDVNKSPIKRITPDGVVAGKNTYEVDAIVLATGFDAMTGALIRIDIRNGSGEALAEKWKYGPRAYLGLMISGFPNLFTITGPGSPSVLTNMLPSIEQHVEWIGDCLVHLRETGKSRIDATSEAEDKWVEHVNQVAGGNLRSTCSSWYVGANVPGKPRVFMPYIGGFPAYVKKCDEVVARSYEGFAVT